MGRALAGLLRGAVLKVMLVLCLTSSLAACSEPPDQPDRGQLGPHPGKHPTTVAAPERTAPLEAGATGPAERTVVESTIGGLVVRLDEGVLRIDEARLLRSKEGDEVFVRATIKGPAQTKNCRLLDAKGRSALREAIESEDPSDAAAVSVSQWADTHRTQKLSGGNTLAISFGEDPTRSAGAPDPRNTPFYALYFKYVNTGRDGRNTAMWYDVAHVEGSPAAS
jgi:hypothetical protein